MYNIIHAYISIIFQSGANGRNRSISRWIVLNEYSCYIGGDIVWIKGDNYHTHWPGQVLLRSGIELIRTRKISIPSLFLLPNSYDIGKNDQLSSSSSSPSLQPTHQSFNDSIHSVMIRYFNDDTDNTSTGDNSPFSFMSLEKMKTSVFPFYEHFQDIPKSSFSKVSNAESYIRYEVVYKGLCTDLN